MSVRTARSAGLAGSVASLFRAVMVSLRIASEIRLGMQPKGPMAMTPQEWWMISVREPPTVRIASPVKLGERWGLALAITVATSRLAAFTRPERARIDLICRS